MNKKLSFSTPPRWSIAIYVMSFIFLALAFYRIFKIVENNLPWDFYVDYCSAKAFWTGINPYTPDGFHESGLSKMGPTGLGHPPCTPFIFLPYGALSLNTAYLIHTFFTVIIFYAVIRLSLKMATALYEIKMPLSLISIAITSLLAHAPFFMDQIRLGQLSVFIAYFLLLSLWNYNHNRLWVAGFWWGLVCSIKFFPGIFLLLWLVRKEWKLIFSATLTFLTIAFTMTLFWGWHSWLYFFKAQAKIVEMYIGNITNHSIHGVSLRFLQPSWETLAKPDKFSNLVSICMASSIILLMLYAIFCHFKKNTHAHKPFALLLLGGGICSQWSWSHYHILYFFPAVLLLASEWHKKWHKRISVMAIVLIYFGSLLVDSHSAGTLQRAVLSGNYEPLSRLLFVEYASWLSLYGLFLALLSTMIFRSTEKK
jgi:hypothetical protein